MKVYAELPFRRARQIAGDVAVLLWVLVWIRIGMRLHDVVLALAGPGRTIERAGRRFAGTVAGTGEDVSDVPVIGDELKRSFETVANGGRFLRDAGQAQQDAVATLAVWLGVLLAAIPILLVMFRWLPGRMRWIAEANAAHRLRLDAEDLQLFALRAVATRPLGELRRATPDPAGAFAHGDYEPLAALELNALGLSAAARSVRTAERRGRDGRAT